MQADDREIERRRTVAMEAIKRSFGTQGNEHGVTLFISHHLEEIAGEYWLEHCGTAQPQPEQVLELLVLQSHWGEEDDEGIDTFDFTLPGEVTQYVISVSFSESGEVEDIAMES